MTQSGDWRVDQNGLFFWSCKVKNIIEISDWWKDSFPGKSLKQNCLGISVWWGVGDETLSLEHLTKFCDAISQIPQRIPTGFPGTTPNVALSFDIPNSNGLFTLSSLRYCKRLMVKVCLHWAIHTANGIDNVKMTSLLLFHQWIWLIILGTWMQKRWENEICIWCLSLILWPLSLFHLLSYGVTKPLR